MRCVFRALFRQHWHWRKKFKKLYVVSRWSSKAHKNNQSVPGQICNNEQIHFIHYNFLLFSTLFLLMGIAVRQMDFIHNFISLLILGETLNMFDLVVIDLLWWRNTKRIRLLKIPQKELYQNPSKHVSAFVRALILYAFVAMLDGYLLTLFWSTTIGNVFLCASCQSSSTEWV